MQDSKGRPVFAVPDLWGRSTFYGAEFVGLRVQKCRSCGVGYGFVQAFGLPTLAPFLRSCCENCSIRGVRMVAGSENHSRRDSSPAPKRYGPGGAHLIKSGRMLK
jgi:hypothetical protein